MSPLNFLLKTLQEAGVAADEIQNVQPVSGGSINEAFQLSTNEGNYFVKANNARQFPGMFALEIKGLRALSDAKVIRVPRPIGIDEAAGKAYLVMEYVSEAPPQAHTWKDFGEKLAALHMNSASSYGLEYDNYIGSLNQCNSQENSWSAFFANQRIKPQLKRAYRYFSSGERQRFDRLLSQIDQLVPEEPPALVHGDLWSGNYLVDERGNPVLIDPAVYFGHREMDLAMMHLFGGFPKELFHHYHKAYPLEKAWRERLPLHNLYPLLVHVNLFGEAYTGQVRTVLNKYT